MTASPTFASTHQATGNSADYKACWLEAIAEFNGFGLAKTNAKHQISPQTAGLLFGFKVPEHPREELYVET